jgi:hypothetical protein
MHMRTSYIHRGPPCFANGCNSLVSYPNTHITSASVCPCRTRTYPHSWCLHPFWFTSSYAKSCCPVVSRQSTKITFQTQVARWWRKRKILIVQSNRHIVHPRRTYYFRIRRYTGSPRTTFVMCRNDPVSDISKPPNDAYAVLRKSTPLAHNKQ